MLTKETLMLRCDAAQQFKILEDSNGFITAEGIIASAGEKLVYKDGTETVSESALFSNMDDWEGLPLTLTHPNSLLSPSTAQRHQVGSVIKAWRKDNQLWAKFKVTTKTALDSVRNGMRGLSAGYNVKLDEAKNQVERLNNHLAIVMIGRSPSSGIRSDERRDSFDIRDNNMAMIKFPNGKTVKLDVSDSEVELLQGHIDSLAVRADAADKSLMDMKEKLDKMKKDGENTDKLQATYDALFEKMKKSEEDSKGKMDSADISAIFDTLEKAQTINAKIKLRKDDGTIKTSRELSVEAMHETKLDEKTDDYVAARLDAAIEFSADTNVRKQRGDNGNDGKKENKDSGLTVQQRSDNKFYTGGK